MPPICGSSFVQSFAMGPDAAAIRGTLPLLDPIDSYFDVLNEPKLCSILDDLPNVDI